MSISIKKWLPAVMLTALVGCNDSNTTTVTPVPTPTPPPAPTPDPMMEYKVTVINMTNAQPLSPVAVALHASGNWWMVGQSASAALETVAESGDNSGLTGADFVTASASGDGVVMPGMSGELMVSTTDQSAVMLSVATMLVNTNDAFTGLNAIDVSAMAVGDAMTYNAPVYDAGTEANSEMAGTIPGPADSGEGFNAARDDVDYVAMHPGVVSNDDGLSDSVLTGEHKFDNPSIRIVITRMQ